jgi:hypothetical protein
MSVSLGIYLILFYNVVHIYKFIHYDFIVICYYNGNIYFVLFLFRSASYLIFKYFSIVVYTVLLFYILLVCNRGSYSDLSMSIYTASDNLYPLKFTNIYSLILSIAYYRSMALYIKFYLLIGSC